MYLDSPFARPVSSFRRPAPVLDIDPDVSPDKTVCFRSEWTPYIVGALRQLLLQTTWATDDPAELNLMQARAQLLIALFMEGCPPAPDRAVDGVEFDGEEIMGSLCEALRFQNGKLQAYCCGEWVNIDGQPAQGVGGPTQPGGGATQPGVDGGQICYDGQLQANGVWLVPTIVSSGDTIELSEASGAGWDGTVSPWRCPNGQTFFAGQCVGAGGPASGDPAASVDHMRLVFNIGGTFYDAMNGPVTVPGGVSNAEISVQVNDSALSDNAGSYAFKVCVTNNQGAGPADTTYNFQTSPGSWGPLAVPGGIHNGVWVPGIGFNNTVEDWSGYSYRAAGAQMDVPSMTLTDFSATFDLVPGTNSSGATPGIFLLVNDTIVLADILWTAETVGNGQVLSWHGSQPGVTRLQIFVGASNVVATGDGGGAAILKSARVVGS